MSIENIKLTKGMGKEDINDLISEWLALEDEIFLGANHKHNWKCKCGSIFERTWSKIKSRNSIKCKECRYRDIRNSHKELIECKYDYKYLNSYFKGDILPNGKIANGTYVEILHEYCNKSYVTKTKVFINEGCECGHCCKKYENSFAYHIEQELKLDINDVWDFEKNTVNPYHISKNTHSKVWIKCQEKDYHGSYETTCGRYVSGKRCSYCGNHKVHPKDSFGQWLIDNDLFHLWSNKNIIDPFSIAPTTSKVKIYMLCDKYNYHNDEGGYETTPNIIHQGSRCSYCGNHKVHIKDSFGYKNPEKSKCWHPDNNISPYEVHIKSGKKYKFICDKCSYVWCTTLYNFFNGVSCPKCRMSKGEKKIEEWLKYNSYKYIYNEEYFNDLRGIGNNPLRPDFILPDHKIWIEYDGEFHYKKMYDNDGHEIIKEHDKRKDEYAIENGWKLIRIPYTEFDNIENILEKELNL